jgi:hypothetical protein
MEWCCNIKDFAWLRYDRADRLETLLDQLAKRKVAKLIVDSIFFPERAMYWTRMAARKARERNIEVVAINRRAAIGYASDTEVEPAVYDLQEWGRICGLTRLPLLRVEMAGLVEVGPEILAARIQRVLDSTLQYGVRLLLGGGGLVSTQQLLEAVARIGPDVCSLSVPDQPLDVRSEAWVGEVYDSTHARVRAEQALHTVRIADREAPLEALDDFLAREKVGRRG